MKNKSKNVIYIILCRTRLYVPATHCELTRACRIHIGIHIMRRSINVISEKISGSKISAGTETTRDGATTMVDMVAWRGRGGEWRDDCIPNTLHYARTYYIIQSDSQITQIPLLTLYYNNGLISEYWFLELSSKHCNNELLFFLTKIPSFSCNL